MRKFLTSIVTLLLFVLVSPATVLAAATAAAASGASAVSSAPLTSNGLIAQLLRQIGRWVQGASVQLQGVADTLLEFPSIGSWWRRMLETPAGRQQLLDGAWTLLAVLVVGVAVQWLLTRALQRPRLALAALAARNGAPQVAPLATDATGAPVAPVTPDATAPAVPLPAAPAADVAPAADIPSEHAAVADPSGMTAPPAADSTDATDPNDPSNPADPASAAATAAAARTATAAATVSTTPATPISPAASTTAAAAAGAAPTIELPPPNSGPQPAHHWFMLRHVFIALVYCALDLVPLGGFVLAAGLLAEALQQHEGRYHDLIVAIIIACAATGVIMALTRLFVAPPGGARLIRLSDRAAAYIQKWMRRIVVVAAFGSGIVDAAQQLGLNAETRGTLLKLVALLVHVFLLIVVFQSRQGVARRIRMIPARGPLTTLRNWFADGWALLATLLIAGLWIVWALGVDDGFQKLLHFCIVTAAVIIGARLLGVLALGGLGRLFNIREDGTEVHRTTAERRADRYYPLLRRLVSVLVTFGMVIALLQVWGLNAINWFRSGALGHHLASAATTVAVAALAATLVWELANVSLERRLERWTTHGDLIRAARLRTLLPMLRTSLFVVIALIVGMTGLNQLGVNTAPLLAGASIIGVALGFGSQKLVQDFITGIFLLMENAMQVGDNVTVAGVSGTVEYLSIRTVRLRAGDGSLFIVPFSSVSTVNNSNRGLGNASIKVNVPFGEDIDKVSNTIKEIGAELRADPAFGPMILADLELWGVDQVDGAMVTLVGQIRSRDSGRWGVQREFNRRLMERFRATGIAMANPQLRVMQLPEQPREGGGQNDQQDDKPGTLPAAVTSAGDKPA